MLSDPSPERDSTPHVLLEIARCPIVAEWYEQPDRQSANPCHQIIDYQQREFNAMSRADFQLPEPWRGDLQKAPLLFISSNPSIGDTDAGAHPRWHWDDQRIAAYFTDSFDDQVVDGAYTRSDRPDARRGQYVTFWGGILARARELFGPEVRPGRDYALTEVVHCKSRQEIGVNGPSGALAPCARRYLRRVVAASGARVIVALGSAARLAISRGLRRSEDAAPTLPPWGSVHGPVSIGGRKRLIAFLPHPNARQRRSFVECTTPAELARLRAALVDIADR